MTEDELKTELERAYRALGGLVLQMANSRQPEPAFLAYHSPTIGAALRFVKEGALDGSSYFIGKPVGVLHKALREAIGT